MARYQASLRTQTAAEDVFSYLSDFSNSQEWDPGVVVAERLTAGGVAEGAEFRLVTRFLGACAHVPDRRIRPSPRRYIPWGKRGRRLA